MRGPAYITRVAWGAAHGAKTLWRAVRTWVGRGSAQVGLPCTVCLFVALLLSVALMLPGDQIDLPGEVIRYGEIHYYIP